MTASEPRLPDDFSDVEEINRDSGRLRVTLEIVVALLILVGIYYFFAPEESLELPLPPQEIDPIIRAQIDAAQGAAAPAEQPATARSAAPEATADSPAPVDSPAPSEGVQGAVVPTADGEAARQVVAARRDGSDTRSLAELARLAADYQRQGRVTDAYLIWFYAAREGDGEAAFALGSLYDPNHFTSGNPLLTRADANQAFKWYRLAAGQSVPQAAERLQALRDTLQTQADAGDPAARRLLLNWQ